MVADPNSPATLPRQRVTNACEACRAAKVKCLTSAQGGICRRCLEFKRECVFRTGPRTRRPKQSQLNRDAPRPPPPAGPSKTFSIDFDMPVGDEFQDNLESLAERHERYIDDLIPSFEGEASSMEMYDIDDPPYGLPTPSSSSGHRSLLSLGLKPQFNLDSAEKLLQSFRGMLRHFPCIILPPDATVPSLAKTKPFVLLAILSASSGASALQGHTLYDEEFRKILGLKFVAGGERSLELLQGLLIYVAWYPFHLRPKNKQAFQYVRMAAEIVHDLELIQPPRESISVDSPVTAEEVDGIRTYLACYYLVAAHVLPFLQYIRQTSLTNARFVITWTKLSVLSLEYSAWTSTCCDILEHWSTNKGDHTLSWLVRLSHIVEKAAEMSFGQSAEQNEQHTKFMLMGLESQFREWQSRIPASLGDCYSITIAQFATEIFMFAAPVLKLPVPRVAHDPIPMPATSERLLRCLPILRQFFDFIITLEKSDFSNFSSIDWGRFIQCTILATRLSFPLPQLAEWDHAYARSQLQFGYYLTCLTESQDELTPSSRNADILSASKVVLNVVKTKYEARLANLEIPLQQLPKSIRGCPMLDGSLDQYFPIWDQDIDAGRWGTGSTTSSSSGQPVYHDLWATMTMGWPTGPGDGTGNI